MVQVDENDMFEESDGINGNLDDQRYNRNLL